jgi:hypothetical protein
MISYFCLSMIFSENRFPLFRIMLQVTKANLFNAMRASFAPGDDFYFAACISRSTL